LKFQYPFKYCCSPQIFWIPACAGMTAYGFNFVEAALSDDPHELFTFFAIHTSIPCGGWLAIPAKVV